MDYKTKIQKIVDTFGMSTEVQAKAIGVSVQTIYNKGNDKVNNHSFNEKNYNKLVEYIKTAYLELI